MSTTDMVVAQPLLPMDAAQARGAMQRHQEITRAMLDAHDWIGEPGGEESFVKRSGWSKISRAYSLSTEIVHEQIDRDADGTPIRAHAVVRATEPTTGRFADGDGGCGINEPRFRNYAGTQKVEHDLPATAVTRATNRAISNLVGFGQVSAEEVDADVRAGADGAQLPAWATIVPDADLGPTADQLGAIMDAAGANRREALPAISHAIRDACGGVPQGVAVAIAAMHAALGSAPAPDPSMAPPPDPPYDPLGGEPQ